MVYTFKKSWEEVQIELIRRNCYGVEEMVEYVNGGGPSGDGGGEFSRV